MTNPRSTMAQEIATAAVVFEQRRTGNYVPKSVTVVLSEGTLVITLHEALSATERALAKSPTGVAHLKNLHRQLLSVLVPACRAAVSVQRLSPSPLCLEPDDLGRPVFAKPAAVAEANTSGSLHEEVNGANPFAFFRPCVYHQMETTWFHNTGVGGSHAGKSPRYD